MQAIPPPNIGLRALSGIEESFTYRVFTAEEVKGRTIIAEKVGSFQPIPLDDESQIVVRTAVKFKIPEGYGCEVIEGTRVKFVSS